LLEKIAKNSRFKFWVKAFLILLKGLIPRVRRIKRLKF
jgi:hypothetical protein